MTVAAIWFNYRDKANPFLVVGAFIVAQMLTMGLVAAGFAVGALTSWAGWNAGKRSVGLAEARQPA